MSEKVRVDYVGHENRILIDGKLTKPGRRGGVLKKVLYRLRPEVQPYSFCRPFATEKVTLSYLQQVHYIPFLKF